MQKANAEFITLYAKTMVMFQILLEFLFVKVDYLQVRVFGNPKHEKTRQWWSSTNCGRRRISS